MDFVFNPRFVSSVYLYLLSLYYRTYTDFAACVIEAFLFIVFMLCREGSFELLGLWFNLD